MAKSIQIARHHVKAMFFALTLIFAFLAITSLGHATTYYVGTTGSDGNTCAQARNVATPKETIAAGVACLSSGDTLQVRAGTYVNGQITNPPSGTPSAYTTVRNFPGERPIITSSNLKTNGYVCVVNAPGDCAYIEIRGFEMKDVFNGWTDVGDDTVGYPHHNRFIDNWVHDTFAPAIILYSNYQGTLGGDHLIAQNRFWQVGSHNPGYYPGMNTIYSPGNRTIVENNVFHNCVHAISLYIGSGYLYDVVIRNNVFYDLFRPEIDTWMRGVNGGWAIGLVQWGGRHQVYNNVIYNSGSESSWTAIAIGPSSTVPNLQNDVKIYNNTIYNNINGSALGIWHDPVTTTNTIIRNNIVYLAGGIRNGNIVTNNQTTNPSFLDPARGDLRLQAGSSAIDKGMMLTEVTHDLTGVPRPQGTAHDLGAYELQQGKDTQAPSPPVNFGVH